MSLRVEVFSADLGATADFYVRVLGFRLVRDDRAASSPYLALARDDVQLGVAGRAEVADRAARRPPAGAELVLEVDDLEGERARVADAGWPVLEEVTRRPWGLRDFRLLDPDGWYLRITDRAS
jgi:catechol 2,3-dioxygenase-like lactoylglutathione lyase family enzyme